MGGGEGSYKGGKRDDNKKRGAAGNSTSNTRKQGKNGGVSQYNEHQAAADGVEIIIRGAAASRSLDNITSLILGLKGLKRTIQKLNTGATDLQEVRQQLAVERQGVKNTYHEDFAFLEVMEPETGVINDAITLANASGQDLGNDLQSSSQKKVQSPKSGSSNQKTNQTQSPGQQKLAPSSNHPAPP